MKIMIFETLFLPVFGFSFLFLLIAGVSHSEEAPRYTNRLIGEKSPYLLQHAHNPVDWYPWGDEAFRKAAEGDKPIILSIGYSTCHWCHVMEEESFENPEIAKVMNDHFVSIKVDREERPDLDAIYMKYVMATTGGGGWPMTVFITPDKKPFYGGTYFPPDDKFGTMGFRALLLSISDSWKNRRVEILNSADSAVNYLQNQNLPVASEELSAEVLKENFEASRHKYDASFGGFGSAPKFPMGHSLSCLLRYWRRSETEEALEMVEHTLNAMAGGGLYDQIGGGFHRYSTDRRWFLPHFEKMLYDQALLSKAYLEAYQATRNDHYADISRGVLDYVLREMTSPEGGFYSAQDADSLDPDDTSHKKEGAFYVWKTNEIQERLSKEEADVFLFVYGIREEGNVESDPRNEFTGKNVIYAAYSLEEAAPHFKKKTEEISELLEAAKQKLLAARSKRPPLHLDDKVLADWNGLMIASFAFGSRVLQEPRYREAAVKAGDFVLQKMRDGQGRLWHRYRDKDAGIRANLDDCAFMAAAFMELYEATFDEKWLREAVFLVNQMIDLFWDEERNGFFLTSKDSEILITRLKEDYDGAIPSGNSIAALVLIRLGRITQDKKFTDYAEKTLEAFSHSISSQPTAYNQMLIALDYLIGPSFEVVIAAPEGDPAVESALKEVYSQFTPNKVIVLRKTGIAGHEIEKLAPFVKDKGLVNGKTAFYVCENHACGLPVTDPKQLAVKFSKNKV